MQTANLNNKLQVVELYVLQFAPMAGKWMEDGYLKTFSLMSFLFSPFGK